MNVSELTLPTPDAVRASLYADSLADYVKATWPLVEQRPFKSNWHIDVIADHLQAVSAREIKQLIINIPPRHMKSLSVGVFWPTWEWLQRPETQFMFASYAQRLTARDSLKCRRVIESIGGRSDGDGTLLERYGYQGLLRLLGEDWAITGDQREKMKFENTDFGYRIATSIGGMGTGEGGDVLVVDDPHKADEAESEVERENVIDWIDGTLSTRLNDPINGAKVVVMQRLHERDATGHLLAEGGWVHLCLPAEYEAAHPFVWPDDPRTMEGELLWGDHFDAAAVDRLKRSLGSYRAAGQLQQRPAPAEGILFKRKDFREWRTFEGGGGGAVQEVFYQFGETGLEQHVDRGLVTVFQTCDVAASEKTTADFTVVSTWGATMLHGYPALLWLDLERQQFDELQVPQFLMGCNDRHAQPGIWVETFGAGSAPFKILQRRGYPVREIPEEMGSRVDKIKRSMHAIALCEDHRLFLPVDAAWREDAISELTTFPNAAHDDIVDTVSYAARILPTMLGPQSPPMKPDPNAPKPVAAGVMSEVF